MTDVACGCGRRMSLDPLRGPGAFRCGCGAKIKVTTTDPAPVCSWKGCRTALARTDQPVDLCLEHSAEWRTIWFPEESRGERYTRLGLLCDCSQPTPDQVQRWTEEAATKAARSVVYYIRSGDLVKIGVTTDLTARLKALNVPDLVVLGTEPGDVRLERQRHAEFATERVRGEWFALSPRILDHIRTVVR